MRLWRKWARATDAGAAEDCEGGAGGEGGGSGGEPGGRQCHRGLPRSASSSGVSGRSCIRSRLETPPPRPRPPHAKAPAGPQPRPREQLPGGGGAAGTVALQRATTPAAEKGAWASDEAVAAVGGGGAAALSLALRVGRGGIAARQASSCSAQLSTRRSAGALPLAAYDLLRRLARLLCSWSVDCSLAHRCTLSCAAQCLDGAAPLGAAAGGASGGGA